jgi:phenylalanine ammonia-lyase
MTEVSLRTNKTSKYSPSFSGNIDKTIIVGEKNLTIDEVVSVARHNALVRLTDNQKVLQGIQASRDYISYLCR